MRRSVADITPDARTALFLGDVADFDFDQTLLYDARGRMHLNFAEPLRDAVLVHIASADEDSPVLPATNISRLRMLVNSLLSYHVQQPYGASHVLVYH